MTVAQLLADATRRLQNSGSTTPALDGEVLLAHTLQTDREHILASHQNTISSAHAERFTSLLQRREHHEPVAYLTGVKEFYGRTFLTRPGVFIPRPKTEELVTATLAELPHTFSGSILDVGTGSGAIAVTFASELPHARVIAADINSEALRLASENAKRMGVHITTTASDLLENVDSAADVIVANLPYLPDHRRPDTPEEIARTFEPREALYAGYDGLREIDRLIRQISTAAAQPCLIACELEPTQRPMFATLIKDQLPGYTILTDTKTSADGYIALVRSSTTFEG